MNDYVPFSRPAASTVIQTRNVSEESKVGKQSQPFNPLPDDKF